MNPVNEMHASVITYFSAGKRESLLFLMARGAAICKAIEIALLSARTGAYLDQVRRLLG